MNTDEKIRERLKFWHDDQGKAWREIEAIPEFKGVPAGSLCSTYNGDPVPKVHRRRLGLSSKPPPPAWVSKGADILADLEEKANPQQKRTYNRKGKRVP